LLIANQNNSFDVALEILYMRFFSNRSNKLEHEPELPRAGRQLLKQETFVNTESMRVHRLAELICACLSGTEGALVAVELATRLRDGDIIRGIYLSNVHPILKSLFAVQPIHSLQALFDIEEKTFPASFVLFDDLEDPRSNPADAISIDALIAWCERDQLRNFQLAVSIITFGCRSDGNDLLVWSEQARSLLANAPNPQSVLAIFIQRFRPMGWSGSRAAIMDTYAKLLDQVGTEISEELAAYARVEKKKLVKAIEIQREWETKHDKDRDERFE